MGVQLENSCWYSHMWLLKNYFFLLHFTKIHLFYQFDTSRSVFQQNHSAATF